MPRGKPIDLASYRVLPSEHLLHNELADLMNEISIPVVMVAVDISEDPRGPDGYRRKALTVVVRFRSSRV